MTEFLYIPVEMMTALQKNEWANYLKAIPEAKGFLYQHLIWTDVMGGIIPKEGIGLYLLKSKETGEILVGSLGYRYPLLQNKYWLYFSRGPLFVWENKKYLTQFFQEVRKIEKHAVWMRFDPAFEETSETADFFKIYEKAHKSFHPKKTLVLDLDMSEESIFAQMHSKGRYNIRLAEKKGVEVFGWTYKDGRLSDLPEMASPEVLKDPLGIFADMIAETGKRDGFSVHSRSYFENFLKKCEDSHAFLLLAKQGEHFLGGGIFTYTKDTCTYYYGASLHQYRALMAPYLVQWKAIMYAKNVLSSHTYDFLGIGSADTDPDLAGVTEFKRKFGGIEKTFVGTFEIKVSKSWFFLITLVKSLKKIVRRKR